MWYEEDRWSLRGLQQEWFKVAFMGEDREEDCEKIGSPQWKKTAKQETFYSFKHVVLQRTSGESGVWAAKAFNGIAKALSEVKKHLAYEDVNKTSEMERR